MTDNSTTEFADPPDGPFDPLGKIGKTIGDRYRVRSHMKSGGFGEIYEGYNTYLPDRRLVIKFLKLDDLLDRFENEARYLCLFSHPNICTIIDYIHDERALIIPYISGRDLQRILKTDGPLEESLLLRIGRMLLDALVYAHGKRVAHRDIKPGNIILDEREHPYLIDFGIAKETGDDLTKTGYKILTPQFAAPERHSGEKSYNPFLSDIYEMGVTLYNLATNELPYRNPASPDLRDWTILTQRRLSDEFIAFLKKSAHPDPAQRYQSALEMLTEFQKITSIDRKSRRFPWVVFSVIAFVVALVALGFWFGPDFLTPDKETTTVGDEQPVDRPATHDSVLESPHPVDSFELSEAPSDSRPAGETDSVSDDQQDSVSGTQSEPESVLSNATGPTTASSEVEHADSSGIVHAETEDAREEPASQRPTPVGPQTLDYLVFPSDVSDLLIDGVAYGPDRSVTLKRGRHIVTIVHPDYPIVQDTVWLQDKPVSRVYRLADLFASASTAYLNIAANPALRGRTLVINLNGKDHFFDRVPSWNFPVLAGQWHVACRIVSDHGEDDTNALVDSAKTFPYGGGSQIRINQHNTMLDLSADRWPEQTAISLVFFWSSQ